MTTKQATTEAYEPEYLNRWTRLPNYFGDSWSEFYSSSFGRSRDSDVLERANFRATLTALGFNIDENPPEDCPTYGDDEPTRIIVRENHWAVGWVEWIAIHETDTPGLKIADTLRENFEQYPILDEFLYSEIEDADCTETWSNCYNPRERLQYLRDHQCTKTGIFRAALAAVRGSWYDAAQLLPCPSDIIH